jgi:TatD DNase family protein
MIDTHAHLDFENFDEDREEVISRAFANGVKKIINIGVDLETSKKSIALAEEHDGVFASVGIHPEFFLKGNQGDGRNWIDGLKKMAGHEKVVAIGECGLDYFRMGEIGEIGGIRERQKKGFLAQIEIARELGLPVVVHCREAWEDLYKIISNFKFQISNFQLHCYSGDKKDTEKFLELPNVCFSFSGNITFPKPVDRAEKLAEAVRMVPLERLMLDSDSPFLAPQQVRGKRNEPAYVRHIAEKIAEIKGISVAEVEKATDENAKIFFGI